MRKYRPRRPRHASFRLGMGLYRLDLWWKPRHNEMVRIGRRIGTGTYVLGVLVKFTPLHEG